jgi:hypothetical protein
LALSSLRLISAADVESTFFSDVIGEVGMGAVVRSIFAQSR